MKSDFKTAKKQCMIHLRNKYYIVPRLNILFFPCSVTSDQVNQMMRNVGEKLKDTPNSAPVASQEGMAASEEEDNNPSNYKIGLIPPKTNDRSKMITKTDRRNFDALCRGLPLLPAEKSKDLKCYYQSQHRDSYGKPVAPNPYFLLHPLKVRSIKFFFF